MEISRAYFSRSLKGVIPPFEYPVEEQTHGMSAAERTTIFFLGILLTVAVLEASGVLAATAEWLDEEGHNVYIINVLL